MILLIFIVLAYLCASLSSAVLVCKWLKLPDPRRTGSKNPGTTNVLRISGKKPAAAVLLLDATKGLLPVLVAKSLLGPSMAVAWVALAAIIGHMYPLFFKFQGGKGIATLIGVLLAIQWSVGVVFISIWLGMAKLFRYSSLAALTATGVIPFVAWALLGNGYCFPLGLAAALIFYRHRHNIQRLYHHTEPKFGSKN